MAAPGESATERLTQHLRRAVLRGEYRPGDRLPPERDLAESFGVNRVTVRGALSRLEAMRLVTIRHGSVFGHGGHVSVLDPGRLEQGADQLHAAAGRRRRQGGRGSLPRAGHVGLAPRIAAAAQPAGRRRRAAAAGAVSRQPRGHAPRHDLRGGALPRRRDPGVAAGDHVVRGLPGGLDGRRRAERQDAAHRGGGQRGAGVRRVRRPGPGLRPRQGSERERRRLRVVRHPATHEAAWRAEARHPHPRGPPNRHRGLRHQRLGLGAGRGPELPVRRRARRGPQQQRRGEPGGGAAHAHAHLYDGKVPAGSQAHGSKHAPTYASPSFDTASRTGDFRLEPGAAGFDDGVVIPNFNDDHAGEAPDRGAHEGGTAPRRYGIAAATQDTPSTGGGGGGGTGNGGDAGGAGGVAAGEGGTAGSLGCAAPGAPGSSADAGGCGQATADSRPTSWLAWIAMGLLAFGRTRRRA